VRLQPVVGTHADETAPAGQVPDQRPCFAGLVAGVKAATMEVQQDRHAGRPVAAVVQVQRATPRTRTTSRRPGKSGERRMRPRGRLGPPALCMARHTTTTRPASASSATPAPAAPTGESRSPSTSAHDGLPQNAPGRVGRGLQSGSKRLKISGANEVGGVKRGASTPPSGGFRQRPATVMAGQVPAGRRPATSSD
jgi:hypothetical protein